MYHHAHDVHIHTSSSLHLRERERERMEAVVGNCPSQELALTNLAFVSPATRQRLAECSMVEVGNGYVISLSLSVCVNSHVASVLFCVCDEKRESESESETEVCVEM